jgi:hypothetical protein
MYVEKYQSHFLLVVVFCPDIRKRKNERNFLENGFQDPDSYTL